VHLTSAAGNLLMLDKILNPYEPSRVLRTSETDDGEIACTSIALIGPALQEGGAVCTASSAGRTSCDRQQQRVDSSAATNDIGPGVR
jgi:hypothetical protein